MFHFECQHSTTPIQLVARVVATSALVLALAFNAGCTSTVAPASSGPCVDRSGSYILRVTQRSGTCGNDGDVAESVVNIDATAQQAFSANCTDDSTVTADNCSIQFTTTCKREDLGRGWTTQERGKSTWTPDGAHGSATAQLTVLRGDGILECTSTVDITWERQ
jgi:hypothetical protein